MRVDPFPAVETEIGEILPCDVFFHGFRCVSEFPGVDVFSDNDGNVLMGIVRIVNSVRQDLFPWFCMSHRMKERD